MAQEKEKSTSGRREKLILTDDDRLICSLVAVKTPVAIIAKALLLPYSTVEKRLRALMKEARCEEIDQFAQWARTQE